MSKKTVSLKEFYENHGSSRVSTYNNLPVRPRCDRDDDQGLHLRLAQNCTLDSGKAYPQRHVSVKEGPYAEYGRHSSSDGVLVGDVDYYRPRSHAPTTGPQHHSYYARRQGPPPRGPSPQDRPAQHGYEPTGTYPQHRGPVSPSGMPPAGGPPGAGGMGGPVHHDSAYSNYPAGTGYGRPHQHMYSPPAGSFGAGPQPPYGPTSPHGSSAGGGAGQGPAVMAGSFVVGGLPPLAPHMASGPGGYGMPPGPYGMPPPPPPPPRQVPAQMSVMDAVPGARADGSKLPPTAQVAAAAPSAPAARPGNEEPAGRVDTQPAANSAAAAKRATPFAAASPPEPEPAAPAGPRNEFAERLAQRAMASAARAQSTLLAGSRSSTSSGSFSRGGSLAADGSAQPPAAVSALDIPAANAAPAGTDSGASSPGDQQGVFVRPSHPFGRPKLALKPRAAPLDAPAPGSGNYSSTSSDSGDAPTENGSGSAASSFSGGRPRLQLLPRGSSLSTDSSTGAVGATGARKASVFGDAKPREEVLKERGLDPILVDAAVELGLKPTESMTGRQDSSGDRVSRFGPSHTKVSSSEDEWHTVAGHGRKGSAVQRDSRLVPEGDSFDPFFGGSGSAKASNTGFPPASAFSRDIMRDGYGSNRRGGVYGSPRGRDSGFGQGDEEVDEGVFRRALPTRQLPLAL